MESDLYGIYSLVVFVSEIELVRAANVRTRALSMSIYIWWGNSYQVLS